MSDLDHMFDNISRWLVDELEKMKNQENASWIKPWTEANVVIGGALHTVGALPSNIKTPKKYYSIINHLFLLTQMNKRNSRYKTNFWITSQAIEQLGIFDSLEEEPYRIVLFPKDSYNYFFRDIYHVEQIKNSEDKLGYKFINTNTSIQIKYEKCKIFLKTLQENHGLKIERGLIYGEDLAAFDVRDDVVFMPDLTDFMRENRDEGEAHYWSTMWHECIHWTGHQSRLDRKYFNEFGTKEYAYEELIAEVGSAYLCAYFGIEGRLQHANYLNSWSSIFREERNERIIGAFAFAQKAVQWLIDSSRSPRSSRSLRGARD